MRRSAVWQAGIRTERCAVPLASNHATAGPMLPGAVGLEGLDEVVEQGVDAGAAPHVWIDIEVGPRG